MTVLLTTVPDRPEPPALLAADHRARQHGRRTLRERRNHYAIDPRAVVTIHVNGVPTRIGDGHATTAEHRAAS